MDIYTFNDQQKKPAELVQKKKPLLILKERKYFESSHGSLTKLLEPVDLEILKIEENKSLD